MVKFGGQRSVDSNPLEDLIANPSFAAELPCDCQLVNGFMGTLSRPVL